MPEGFIGGAIFDRDLGPLHACKAVSRSSTSIERSGTGVPEPPSDVGRDPAVIHQDAEAEDDLTETLGCREHRCPEFKAERSPATRRHRGPSPFMWSSRLDASIATLGDDTHHRRPSDLI
jgi:hypothetical protein